MINHNVYVSGPLTDLNTRFKDKKEYVYGIYDEISNACSKYGLRPYFPHKAPANPNSHKIKNSSQESELREHAKVWTIDHERVKNAKLVIAYVGLPSAGVGAEIEMCRGANVPVILLWERNSPISRLISGHPAVKTRIRFSEPKDIVEELSGELWEAASKINLDVASQEDCWPLGTIGKMEDLIMSERKQLRTREGKVRTVEEWREMASESQSMF